MAEFHNPFTLPTAILRQMNEQAQPKAPYPPYEPVIAAPQQERRKPGRPKKLQKVAKA